MQCEKDTMNESPIVNRDVCACLNENFPTEAITSTEAEALLFMLEEEKLARDVYLNLLEKWDSHVFSNISSAEQRHMDMLSCLIKKYELELPAQDLGIGEFEDEQFQALYDSLMSKGLESLTNAYAVGATIEDVDIYDLMNQSTEVNNVDILAVFSELTRGSRNHMRAFHRNLDNLDEVYQTQFISDELYQEIINSPKEKGGAICGTCDSNNKCKKNKNGNNKNCTQNQNGKNGDCIKDKSNCKTNNKKCNSTNQSNSNSRKNCSKN